MSEKEIGVIEHFFDKIGVAAIKITQGELLVGDTIHIAGHTTDFTMIIASMQIEHDTVEKVTQGVAVGIKVPEKVRVHDKIFKVANDG